MNVIKEAIKRSRLYPLLCPLVLWRRERMEIRKWIKLGRPVPPPHAVKQKNIRNYRAQYNIRVLVETGTYLGDMVEAMKACFDKIYSIELGEDLYQRAQERFRSYDHITLLQGDSGLRLEEVVKTLDQAALFWLDGHYSAGITAKGDKETPIYEELSHIFNAPDLGHIILIDDARCFGDERYPEYPAYDVLKAYILSKRPGLNIFIQNDSIVILPPKLS